MLQDYYIMWFPLLFWVEVYNTTSNGAMCALFIIIISLLVVILRVEGTIIGCRGQCLAFIDRARTFVLRKVQRNARLFVQHLALKDRSQWR